MCILWRQFFNHSSKKSRWNSMKCFQKRNASKFLTVSSTTWQALRRFIRHCPCSFPHSSILTFFAKIIYFLTLPETAHRSHLPLQAPGNFLRRHWCCVWFLRKILHLPWQDPFHRWKRHRHGRFRRMRGLDSDFPLSEAVFHAEWGLPLLFLQFV